MVLNLKTAPTVEPVSLAEVITQLRLDVTSTELATGSLVVGRYYQITACTTNYFYTGCAVWDTFKASAATSLSSTNKVREIYEGTHLSMLIKAAREHVEEFCGPLITQTWYQYENDFPSGDYLHIGKPRLQSITSITYLDEDAVSATVSSAYYTVDTANAWKPRVVLKPDSEWPEATLFNSNPVTIEFVAGYGATASTVPDALRMAILMLVSNWYEHREPIVQGQSIASIPWSIDQMIRNYSVC